MEIDLPVSRILQLCFGKPETSADELFTGGKYVINFVLEENLIISVSFHQNFQELRKD